MYLRSQIYVREPGFKPRSDKAKIHALVHYTICSSFVTIQKVVRRLVKGAFSLALGAGIRI